MSETTVYRVFYDVNHFQELGYEVAAPDLSLYRFTGASRAADWAPVGVRKHHRSLSEPRLWHVGGTMTFAMDVDVKDRLEPYLSRAGELLPLVGPTGEELFILNITRVVDCVDGEHSTLGPSEWRLSFVDSQLPEEGLFKIPQARVTQIFVVDRDPNRDSFITRLKTHDLTGLELVPVWTSSSGPLDYTILRV